MSGTDKIRQAVSVKAKKVVGGFATFAKEHNLSTATLEAFAAGKVDLPEDALKALATDIWGGACEFVPDRDVLRSTNKNQPTPLCTVLPDPVRGSGIVYVPGAPPPPGPAYVSGPKDPVPPKRVSWFD